VRLAQFILASLNPILTEWEAFAGTLLPAAGRLDSEGLRDHAEAMLRAIALDLASEQSEQVQLLKSQGLAPEVAGAPRTAAQTHATLRARDGFDINQMTAEYRALRATVLRLWLAESAPAPDDLQDIIRFNEAIDQALTESTRDFSLALESSRNLLLGMLGHDMRNPLGVIVSTAEYLNRLNLGETVSAAAYRLMRSGARIQALVSDLVDFSRTQLGVGINVVRAPIDLAEIFKEQLELQRAASPNRNFALEVCGDVVGAWDGNRLHQVLGNLVGNALKYGNADSPIEVKLVGDAVGVCFSIANEGAAISAPFMDEMFEPLTRGPQATKNADPTNTSLGLGLYICREIVRAHEGVISVQSDDKKTVFTVTLPR
jgi:signal transduction histidine kinase